jgi:oligopeptide transport system ATP-binding protein
MPLSSALFDHPNGLPLARPNSRNPCCRTAGALSALAKAMSLLEVSNLKVHFPVKAGLFSPVKDYVRAVDGVSFSIAPGKTLGLVGESGCGKTSLSRAIMRLIDPTAGSIRLDGEDITKMHGAELRARRRKFQMVFQDPYSSLNPRMTAGAIIGEPITIHGLARTAQERRDRIARLLEDVGLSADHANRYPHELCGGQRQRIAIARALAVEPKLIIADEPVSALDVSIQAQVINLLQDIQKEHRVAYLFISHDLTVVEHLSHEVMVMYLGRIVESGPAREICRNPLHPYTQALLQSVPDPFADAATRVTPISGDLPSPVHPPSGCHFHPRCPLAVAACRVSAPPLRSTTNGRIISCSVVSTEP